MSRPLRVLHLAAGNLFGGIETFLVTLARRRGACPELDSEFALCFEGRLEQELQAAGVRVHPLGAVRLRAPLSVIGANLRLRRVLEARRFDVVVSHGAWPHVVFGPLARRSSVTLATWSHGAPLRPAWLDRAAAAVGADLLIANSQHTAHRMAAWWGSVPREVVYCPVEPFVGAREARERVREQLQTSPNAVVIAVAARIERLKGHDLLLQALSTLGTTEPWILWVIGGAQRPHEREYLGELVAYAAHAGIEERIRFLGQRGDVPQLLAAADLYCQPNTEPEGFGISFVEALYAGLPVITTAMGGALEIVDDSCGILTAPDALSVAAALRRLVSDSAERKRLGRDAPARARAVSDPVARIKDMARIFRAASPVR